MTSEIFNFIQTQPQTQTQTQIKGTQNNNDSGAEPGLFDSLINEYADTNNTSGQPENINIAQEQQTLTFGSNALSQSMIDILAGVTKDSDLVSVSEFTEAFIPEKNFADTQNGFAAEEASIALAPESALKNTGELVSRILNDENIAAKISSMPEDNKQEVSKILETLQNHESTPEDIKSALEKLYTLVNEVPEDNNSRTANIPDDKAELETDKNFYPLILTTTQTRSK